MLSTFFVILLIMLFLLLLFYPFNFRKRVLFFYVPALIAFLLTIGMIQYPKEAFEASLNGLSIWWNIVFPALLPFFIFSQILIGLGVVRFLGVLLEPIMRPIFNVPGDGSFVMAMGLASGFPIGAVLTTKLRQQKLCSKVEAERLVSFTNTADPLFMFGAVAVGMLHAPETGIVIATAHYLSSISTGLLMRFYGKKHDEKKFSRVKWHRKQKNIFSRALEALVMARKEDNRPFGQLMGEAVKDSVSTLMLIGGFIMLFSVIISMMELAGVVGLLVSLLSPLLVLAGLDPSLTPAFISGLFEVDLGCQMAAELHTVPLEQRVTALGAIIAWSGLSVHAQVASIASPTDINILPYSVARIIHALLAGFYSMLLLGPLQIFTFEGDVPAFLQSTPQGGVPFIFERTLFMGGRFLFILLVLLLLSLLVHYFEKRSKKNPF